MVTNAYAQPMQRYRSDVFTHVAVQKDLSYNPCDVQKKANHFDLYQPADDTATLRPLIIWMHGGGFRFGSKRVHSMRFWNKLYARKGYVCASINYTLSHKNPVSHFDELLRTCYTDVQEVRMAIAYFKAHAAQYHIDPDRIVLAGNSAGAILALQTVYSNNTQLGQMAKIPEAEIAKGQPYQQVAAVVSYWGAIFNIDWLASAHVPIVCVHGAKDHIVPAEGKAPLYGSIPIHAAADKLGIPNTLKIYPNSAHELQRIFNPLFAGHATHRRWNEAGQFTADFLYPLVAP